LISTSHKTTTFTVRLAVTTYTEEKRTCLERDWIQLPKFRPNHSIVQCAVARQRTLPWQPHHRGHIGNVIRCDHSSFDPVGPLPGELWHFQYFPTWRPAAILIFKKNTILIT